MTIKDIAIKVTNQAENDAALLFMEQFVDTEQDEYFQDLKPGGGSYNYNPAFPYLAFEDGELDFHSGRALNRKVYSFDEIPTLLKDLSRPKLSIECIEAGNVFDNQTKSAMLIQNQIGKFLLTGASGDFRILYADQWRTAEEMRNFLESHDFVLKGRMQFVVKDI